ncbi:MAG: NAD(P)H-dependent oxidoreductase [Burkholderiales bacterium]|nr:NAD(P)H-dependent oxidoreductase [Burkholderiales bacterium]
MSAPALIDERDRGGALRRPSVRRETKYVPLTKARFHERFFERFRDPAFDRVRAELERVCDVAWDGYIAYRKSPRRRPAGRGFARPRMALPAEWLETRARIEAARRRQGDPRSRSRILIVNGSTRSEHSCPGEISKTRRLARHAQQVIERLRGCETDVLDLSALADEPWRVIHPCKACVSTAQPLCHWPCSCYPNHAMGQTNDWMAEIYERWAAAHGIMILCPVHWYQAPASLKLMMDRLVCADGGNPDPTTTRGKDPLLAKRLELGGWDYPKHLAGRAFSVVAHGDAAGPENLRRMLADWLTDMGMIPAGPSALIDTWIGWYEPYATSHAALDRDEDLFAEVRNAAIALANMVKLIRTGRYVAADAKLRGPREK